MNDGQKNWLDLYQVHKGPINVMFTEYKSLSTPWLTSLKHFYDFLNRLMSDGQTN